MLSVRVQNVSAHIASLYPVENCTKAKNKTVTCRFVCRLVGLLVGNKFLHGDVGVCRYQLMTAMDTFCVYTPTQTHTQQGE